MIDLEAGTALQSEQESCNISLDDHQVIGLGEYSKPKRASKAIGEDLLQKYVIDDSVRKENERSGDEAVKIDDIEMQVLAVEKSGVEQP